jgi:hypothetical protein
MAQSFDGVTLRGTGSIVNFGGSQPPSVLNLPVAVINSNSRTTPIVIKDGENSVPFAGTYRIFTGGKAEYDLIKAKEGVTGTLINGSQTINNVLLRAVSIYSSLGSTGISCQLSFEYLGA